MPVYPFGVTSPTFDGEGLRHSTYLTLNGALRGYEVAPEPRELWVQTQTHRYRIDPLPVGEVVQDSDII